MTNYLLSIDPSIKNTGFTLWEKRCHVIDCENNTCIELKLWTPTWIKSYSFEKFKNGLLPTCTCGGNNEIEWVQQCFSKRTGLFKIYSKFEKTNVSGVLEQVWILLI